MFFIRLFCIKELFCGILAMCIYIFIVKCIVMRLDM